MNRGSEGTTPATPGQVEYLSRRDEVIADDWYAHSFDELYPIIYAHRTAEAARPEADFAIRELNLQPDDAVLDLCCGNGRHMVHFRNRTSNLVGLDYSVDLLRPAQEQLGRNACLVRGDMRAIPFKDTFDVVVNFFTSFGYFASRAENVGVAANVAESLKTGGRFLIDYMNREWTRKTLQPDTVREQDGYRIEEERWIDSTTHRINKTTTVTKDGRQISHSGESVQLYTREEFTQLLQEGGLTVRAMFGDYTGAAYSESLPRMIAIGVKA